MTASENVIYSAIVRRGPDISHYDVYFEEDRIVFKYLGEHWETFRPRTGLQKRMDLFVYSLRKKRQRRTSESSPDDFAINVCEDLISINLVKLLDKGVGRITLHTRSLGFIEIEYPLKIHDIVKKMYKRVLARLEICRE